ncbi:MAG: hypothetical protein ACOVQ8_13125 [Elstera sp.]
MSLEGMDWISFYKSKDDLNENITKNTLINLARYKLNINPDLYDRSVYVIRVSGRLTIRYPGGVCPIVYIGEGNFINRIVDHWNGWVYSLYYKDGFNFDIHVCFPRVRGNYLAYKSVEAHLIEKFYEDYSCLPLYNSQRERELYQYRYNDNFYKIFEREKGSPPKWAIMPCKSHPSYDKYYKGLNWDAGFSL